MREKRVIYIQKRLAKICDITEIETQKLRAHLLTELQNLFEMCAREARTADNREDWVKICGHLANSINTIADSFEETEVRQALQKARELIQRAVERTKRAGETGEAISGSGTSRG